MCRSPSRNPTEPNLTSITKKKRKESWITDPGSTVKAGEEHLLPVTSLFKAAFVEVSDQPKHTTEKQGWNAAHDWTNWKKRLWPSPKDWIVQGQKENPRMAIFWPKPGPHNRRAPRHRRLTREPCLRWLRSSGRLVRIKQHQHLWMDGKGLFWAGGDDKCLGKKGLRGGCKMGAQPCNISTRYLNGTRCWWQKITKKNEVKTCSKNARF